MKSGSARSLRCRPRAFQATRNDSLRESPLCRSLSSRGASGKGKLNSEEAGVGGGGVGGGIFVEGGLAAGGLAVEIFVGAGGGDAAAGGAVDHADLHEVGLVHFFDGVFFFA